MRMICECGTATFPEFHVWVKLNHAFGYPSSIPDSKDTLSTTNDYNLLPSRKRKYLTISNTGKDNSTRKGGI